MIPLTDQIAWETTYPKSPPIGWALRERYPDRWLRFHSLPDSKRYPETESECAELLRRHNVAATRLFASRSPLFLIQGEVVESDTVANVWAIAVNQSDFRDDFEADKVLRFRSEAVYWQHGRFDNLLLEVADWKKTMVTFFSPKNGNVYAPYDGGADLFLPDRQERDGMRKTLQNWLSSHPAGL